MPSEPFRFLHAANICLDATLRGVGPIPPQLRELVEDATLSAFEQLLEACLSLDVHGLLLGGQCFGTATPSIRKLAAFAQGLERLSEYQIPVFIAPTDFDPDSAWWPGRSLPETLHWLSRSRPEPVDFQRDGQLLAKIQYVPELSDNAARFGPRPAENGRTSDTGRGETAKSWFSIRMTNVNRTPDFRNEISPLVSSSQSGISGAGRNSLRSDAKAAHPGADILPAGYWAMADGRQPSTESIGNYLVHNPGATQGLTATESGSYGCTLVDVNAAGKMTTTFVPLGPICWDSQEISVGHETTRQGLHELLRGALQALEPGPQEELRLWEWVLRGSGPLFEHLCDSEQRRLLTEELRRAAMNSGAPVWTHTIRLVSVETSGETSCSSNRLTGEFIRRLAAQAPRKAELVAACLQDSSLAGTPWESRLQSILSQLNHKDILESSLCWGISTFAAPVEASR